jgi:chromosome segregation protein
MAQVTMTMVDPTGTLLLPGVKREVPAEGESAAAAPTKEQEFTITRRLFRSGESEYLINGKNARLRDIQDLFMGTGLGPESYAIIEQGRIGQILSSKPLDRRAVIEEAAGISKFKTRRRLAEAKLEGAKQNLNRVFDILEEVSRQANSLKRQAAKAKRAEEVRGELEVALRSALSGRYFILERAAAKVALDLNAAAHQYQELHTQVEAGEQQLKKTREALYQTDSELNAARTRLNSIEVEAERTRGLIDSQVKQIAAIEQRLQQGESETESLMQRAEALNTERTHLAASLEELQKQAAEARDRLSAKNADRDALQRQLNEKERAIESNRTQVVRLLGEAAQLRNQVAQIESYLQANERDIARVGKDEESASADLTRLEGAKKEFGDRLAARQLELESLSDQRQRVEGDLNERRTAAHAKRNELEALRAESSRLRARRDSLEEILSHRAYTTESVKRLFTAVERKEADGLHPAGVLADFVDLTDPQFEKATEEFLHEELEYVVVKAWDHAHSGIELLRGDLDGRATFLVEPNLHSPEPPIAGAPVPEPVIGPETGIVGRLSDGLRFTNGLTNAPAAILPRLARCFLAESRDAAQRLALQYPDLYFLLSDGVCYHGHAVTGGKRTGSGPLALKRELREISGLFLAKETATAAAKQLLDQCEAEIQALTEELERLRTDQQRQEKETLVLDQEMRKINEEFNRANQKLSVSRMELERLNRDAARQKQEHEQKLALVGERDTARVALEQALEQSRAEVETVKGHLSTSSEEHSVLRVELAGLEERRRGVENAVARIDQQVREVERRRSELSAEMERIGINRTGLLESNLQLDQKATQFAEEIGSLQQAITALAEQEAAGRAALNENEESLSSLRNQSAEAQERRSQIELELVRRQSELKFLDETCRKDLNIAVSELASQREEGVPEPDELAVADAEEKVSELRKKLEAIGPVNPEALAEYQEAQARYDFLNTQRQDLLDSIRDTEKAIQDIDVESRKRFTEAFHAINENFRKMFTVLFGGGTGEMRLTGEGDALDQGIEIVASPPGKRLQNVLLLSGGEKALTAISLLMSIFQYQPSPFCILDEVDAPLDEANVGRLSNLLRDMAAQTQFIVITHAKKTMEAAESLYGVTMQEQGVSKLVSVRLQSAPPPPPAPTPPRAAVASA